MKLADYEDIGLSPDEVHRLIEEYTALVYKWEESADKFYAYRDAEEEGRLLSLPYMLGETVYRIRTDCAEEECQNPDINCFFCKFGERRIKKTTFDLFLLNPDTGEIRENIYRSKEEAEAKLKEIEEKLKEVEGGHGTVDGTR